MIRSGVSFLDNNKPLDTIFLRKGKKESFQRTLSFNYNLSSDKLKPGTDFTIKANLPIDNFDPSLVTLKEDSTEVSNFTLEKDSTDARYIKLKYRWHQANNYTLVIGEAAFTDIYGDKNKRTTRHFNVDKPENYSLLTLSVTLPDTGKSYIVQLMNDQKQLLRSDVIHKTGQLVYKNYLTGKYAVRVIYDDNNNGKWDSGSVKLRTQPENIWVDQDIITLRPNWEQVTPISVPKEPSTP